MVRFGILNIYQQAVFLRQVYFEELNGSGLEFSDPSSPRDKSYIRGRTAIATLFPDGGPHAAPNTGSITTSSATGYIDSNELPARRPSNGVSNYIAQQFDAGIHTDFGGAIQLLTPSGQTLVGVDGGITPGASAGLITQGSGDIDIYSLGSALLGQSRVMTTCGGDILVWSADCDINAGRGSPTTATATSRCHRRCRRSAPASPPSTRSRGAARQRQSRGAADHQCRQHPGAGHGGSFADGAKSTRGGFDFSKQHRGRRTGRSTDPHRRQQGTTLDHHRRSAGIWRRRVATTTSSSKISSARTAAGRA